MAELTQQERLQPSLLDRLTDEQPEQKQESRSKRILSPSKLRESVRRDLAWLFNTTNAVSGIPELVDMPLVSQSVLNYGLPDFTGHTASTIDIELFEDRLRTAIWNFEPRLLRHSISVKLMLNEHEMSHNAMSFTIEAELWAQPLPLRLFLRTDVDLETGNVEVSETSSGGA